MIHRKSGRFPPETRRCGSCRLCCGNSAAKTFWITSSHANAEHHKRVGLHYISIFKSRRCKSRVYFLHPAEKSWSDRGRDELGPKVTAFSRFNIMGVALSSCTTKTGRILDSRRTPQKVGLLQFALRLRARLNPSRDSAGRTMVMQWQRRVKNHSSGGQTLCLVTHLWRLSFFASMVCRSTNQPTISTESSRRTEENPLHVVMSGNDLANYGCHGVVTIRASVEFETCRESKKWAQQPSQYPLRRLRRLPNLASTTDPEIFVRGASLLFMYGAQHVVNRPALDPCLTARYPIRLTVLASHVLWRLRASKPIALLTRPNIIAPSRLLRSKEYAQPSRWAQCPDSRLLSTFQNCS